MRKPRNMQQQQQRSESSQAFAAIHVGTRFSVPEPGKMVTADGRFTITMRTAHPGEFLDRRGSNGDISSCWFVTDELLEQTTLAGVVFMQRGQDEDAAAINGQYGKMDEIICWLFEEEAELGEPDDYATFLGLPIDASPDAVQEQLFARTHTNFSWFCEDEAVVRTDVANRNMWEEEEEKADNEETGGGVL
jgi:hypothetical protein